MGEWVSGLVGEVVSSFIVYRAMPVNQYVTQAIL